MVQEITKDEYIKDTKVISAFPGTGKSYCIECMCNKYQRIQILDIDSSLYNWVIVSDIKPEPIIKNNTKNFIQINPAHKEYNPEFPRNYIEHIRKQIGKVDIIFVSSHQCVRDALKENSIPYTLIYPDKKILAEYVGRYYMRGNNTRFINMIIENWDTWIDSCEDDAGCQKHKLNSCEYLSDFVDKLHMNKK